MDKTVKYRVISLDVWGHSHEDCAEYDCPCMDESVDCECYYQVNDRFSCGVIECKGTELPSGDWTDDKELHRVLIEEGYLKESVRLEDLDIDGDDCFIEVNDAENGEPVFQLERMD